MSSDTIEKLRHRTDVKKEEKHHSIYWIPEDEVRVRQHYSQGQSQSATSCLLGKILYKDTWDMSQEAMHIDINTESKSKNNMWLVSVYID